MSSEVKVPDLSTIIDQQRAKSAAMFLKNSFDTEGVAPFKYNPGIIQEVVKTAGDMACSGAKLWLDGQLQNVK